MVMFMKQGFVCDIEKDPNEPNEMFAKRGNFIVSQQPKTNEELIKIITYSRIYANIYLNGCTYSTNIMEKIKEMEEKMWIK